MLSYFSDIRFCCCDATTAYKLHWFTWTNRCLFIYRTRRCSNSLARAWFTFTGKTSLHFSTWCRIFVVVIFQMVFGSIHKTRFAMVIIYIILFFPSSWKLRTILANSKPLWHWSCKWPLFSTVNCSATIDSRFTGFTVRVIKYIQHGNKFVWL